MRCWLSALLLLCAASAVATENAPLELVSSVDLPHGAGRAESPVLYRLPQAGEAAGLDTESGKEISSWDTAGHSDGMAFDSAHKCIYVPGAEGYIAVYQQKGCRHYELMAKVPTAPGAKTCLLVPELKRLYVAVSPGEGKFGARVLAFETLP